jgi:uncharacterized protein (TIGR00255 family)
MESMTGFGTHTMTSQGFTITVEARSWNHKALSTSLSLPDLLAGREEEVATAVKERFIRGSFRVSAVLQVPQDSAGSFSVDMVVLRTYLKAALGLLGEPGVEDRISVGELLALPGVAIAATAPGPDRESLASLFSSCLAISLDHLRRSRLEEGEALSAVFIDAFTTLRTLVEPVLDDLRKNVTRRFDRLRARVSELLGDTALDQTRMLQELAFLADRVDVSEEVQRLLCHLDHAGRTLTGDTPDAGRTLGFILQEMHREVNTIGAKSDDPELSEKVVRMKNILASLKEQAANVQ